MPIVASAFVVTLAGVALRELYHAKATSYFVEYWRTPSDPDGPPKCYFDCTLSVPFETWTIGAIALGLIVAGPGLLVFDWVLRRK